MAGSQAVPRSPAEKLCLAAGHGTMTHFAAQKGVEKAFLSHFWANKESYEALVSHWCPATRVFGRASRARRAKSRGIPSHGQALPDTRVAVGWRPA